jgi:hypothetical protein
LGNCQGPPTFGGPQIADFIFVVLFFWSSTSKKFACGAKIPSKFFGCGADIINNFACGTKNLIDMPAAAIFFFKFACGTSILKKLQNYCLRRQISRYDNTSFLLIKNDFELSSIFGGPLRTDCQGPPRTLIRPCIDVFDAARCHFEPIFCEFHVK